MKIIKSNILQFRPFIFYVLLLLMFGCKTSGSKKINISILKELDELGFRNVSVDSKEKNNFLQVDFDFQLNKTDRMNSYHTGFQANKILIKSLVYKLNKLFGNFDVVNFVLRFEEGKEMFIKDSDTINFKMTSDDINKVKTFFDENLLFLDFINYAFKEIENTELVKCEGLILFMDDNLNSFEYKGSFWDLLYDYSLGCNDIKKNLRNVYNFISLLIFLNDGDVIGIDEINKRQFNYFLDKCHFESDLYMNLTIPELFDYLDEKYY